MLMQREMMVSGFPARLAEASDRAGMSQADIARAIGSNRSLVNAWFKGKHMPNAANLSALSNALGVRADWLMGMPQGRDDRA